MSGWQIVVLVLGFFAFIGLESYLNVLKERTAAYRETLYKDVMDRTFGGVDDLTEQRLTNGDS